jgi:hypothetical protein
MVIVVEKRPMALFLVMAIGLVLAFSRPSAAVAAADHLRIWGWPS